MKTPKKIIKFYNSSKWRRVQKYIRAKKRGLCEECGKAGWEVHHIIPLTLENVNNDEVAIGEDNLQLLCTSCHNSKRSVENQIRNDVTFNEYGDLIKKVPPGH